MMDLGALRSSIVNVFASDGLRELPKDEYSAGKYPKLLPVMHSVYAAGHHADEQADHCVRRVL